MNLQQEWMIDLARDCSEQATRFAQLMRDLAAERFAEASETLENEEEEYEEVVHRAAA
jgi:hypothetical protein